MTEYLMKSTLMEKAQEISARVKEELGFTVNIGLSSNKLLAKMASDFEKPDKIHTLFPNEIPKKMWPLPVRELLMLGRKTAPKLYNMGIKTIGDLAKSNQEELIKKFGKHGKLMWEYANGIDNSEVIYKKEEPKGVGNSITLPRDMSDKDQLLEVLMALTEQVCYRLRKYNLLANVVNVQLRNTNFKDISHQKKLDNATDSTKNIFNKAKELFEEIYNGQDIRLVGIRVDNLEKRGNTQISLFDGQNNKKQDKIDSAVDEIKNKYGYLSITRATNIKVNDILKIK